MDTSTTNVYDDGEIYNNKTATTSEKQRDTVTNNENYVNDGGNNDVGDNNISGDNVGDNDSDNDVGDN